MGKRHDEPSTDQPMTASRAVSTVLGELAKGRRLAEIAEITQLPYSRLRRLRDGTRSVDPGELTALRRITGFSTKYDALVGEPDEDIDAIMAGTRMLRAFPDGGAESVIYQIENLSMTLDAQAIADLLKAHAKAMGSARPAPAGQKKSAATGRNMSKSS
jgi:hypothetical protein